MNKARIKKVWTAKQYTNASAACFVLFIIAIGILIGTGNLQGVIQVAIAFFLGGACSSYGAESRKQKMLEGIVQTQTSMDTATAEYRNFLNQRHGRMEEEPK